MKLGFIGLGKMGRGMVKRLKEAGHEVVVFDSSPMGGKTAQELGVAFVSDIRQLVDRLLPPRVVWLMVPHQAVDGVIRELEISGLVTKDIVVDGGNSFYKDTIRRGKELAEHGVYYVDVGVSGGPGGVDRGFCLMVGGDKSIYDQLTSLFDALAQKDGYGYMGRSGSGHYVKMVHNGIEYGMMQSIAEGFELLANGSYKEIDPQRIASVWNHGSVVASFLVEMVERALHKEPRLETVAGEVTATGEGEWSIQTAQEYGIDVDSMKLALQKRIESQNNPQLQEKFAMKLLAAMRGEFGGHEVKRKIKI